MTMKRYIEPSIKIKKIEEESFICMSKHDEEGDGDQLGKETFFDEETDEEEKENIWM